MLNITSNSNGFTVEAINNTYYPDNGTLTFGPNQVIMILDDISEMVTFKDNSNRRTLFSGILGQISIDGVVVTRDNIIEKFAEVATSQGGGGGDMSNYYTKAQSDAKYATKTEVGDYFDNVAYDSQEKKINFFHDNTVVAYVDATDFIKDGMVSNVTITNGNLVITFNVDAGKQDIVIPLSSIFNPANYYTKAEIDGMIPVVPTTVSSFTNDAGYITQDGVIINESFPQGWHKQGTMAQLIADINNDTTAVTGKVYMDTVSVSGLPEGLMQAELKAEIISQIASNEKVILFTVTSSNVAPYHWEYTSAYGSLGTWRKWVVESELATVATSGSYNDLLNTPTIPTVPTNVSDFTNDAGYLTDNDVATVATTGDYDDLTNKPTIPVVPTDVSAFNNDAGYLTQHQSLDNYYTKTEVDADLAAKQDTLTAGANITIENNVISAQGGGTAQVQSDWNQSDSAAVDFIKNKPTIPVVPTDVSAFNNDAGYLTQHQSLAGYATETWVGQQGFAESADLATVATTGDYDDLTNKPTIPVVPTDVSAFTNDAGYTTNVGTITGITMNGTSKGTSGVVDLGTVITEHQSLANYYTKTEVDGLIPSVADYFDGAEYDSNSKRINFKHGQTVKAYIDATAFIKDGMVNNVEISNGNLVITFNADAGKETITIPLTDIFNPANYYDKTATDNLLAAKADSASLATVATSGDYDDLSNKPTIPTVPTNVSAFTNDAGYTTNVGTITGITMNGASKGTSGVVDLGTVITEHQSLSGYATETWVGQQGFAESADLATVATTGDYDDLTNKPTIPVVPTDVSAFNNDAGYLTQHQSLANYYTKTESDAKYVPQTSFDVKEEVIARALNDLNEGKQDTLTAGTNITIENGVISATGGAAQVQADWNQSDSSAVDFIKNKPTIPTVPTNVSAFTNDAGYTTNTGTITGITMNGASKGTSGVVDLGTVITEHQSLSGYATETWVGQQGYLTTQAQADWNESDSSAPDFIKNKPTIPAAQIQSDWNQSSNASADFIKNKPFIPTITYDAQNTALVITTVPPQS